MASRKEVLYDHVTNISLSIGRRAAHQAALEGQIADARAGGRKFWLVLTTFTKPDSCHSLHDSS